MKIPEGYVRVDTDDDFYHPKDTVWLVEPTEEDCGILGPKPGAVSWQDEQAVLDEEYEKELDRFGSFHDWSDWEVGR